MEQERFLQKLAGVLAKLKIPYLVTGGMAVAVWGRPRFTADVDVVMELARVKVNGLAAALLKLDRDVYLDRHMMFRALKTQGEFNVVHPASGLKVDFWMLKDDLFDRQRMQRRIQKRIWGTGVWFSSPEDLMLIKLRWHKDSGSEQQLRDIESILHIQKKLDWPYLRKWALRHSTSRILASLLKKSHGA